MNTLSLFFPLSNVVKQKDTVYLAISIVLYLVIWMAARVLLGAAATLLGILPFVWLLYRLLILIVRIYCILGIVFSVMNYAGKSF